MRPFPNFLLFALVCLTISCGRQKSAPSGTQLRGEWILDSVTGSFTTWNKDYIYITPENQFWRLTYWNDKYLIDSSLTLEGTEVTDKELTLYNIEVQDTVHFTLHDRNGNIFFYHKNIDSEENYKEKLGVFLKDDSLKQALTGRWNLSYATLLPLKPLNSGIFTFKFSLVLRQNREADLILEDRNDSVIHYSWSVQEGMLGFSNGDIGLSSPIYQLDKRRMQISLTKRMRDTFTMVRVNN